MAQDLLQYLHNEYEKAFTRLAKLGESKTAFNCVSTQRWNIMHTAHVNAFIKKRSFQWSEHCRIIIGLTCEY